MKLAIPKLRTIQIKGDIIEVSHPSLHLSYDTIKPIIEQFRTDIEHFKTSSVLLEAILNRKKMLLYGKAIDADTVIPGLDDFVDIGLDETIETIDCVDLKMTSDTYQDIYMKNIDATLERMKAKQYISEKDVKLYYDDSTNRHLVHKLPFINTMFRKTYAKTLAVAYTTGKPVVEYMDLSLTEQSAQITWSDYEELS
jgi:hypothetical protein